MLHKCFHSLCRSILDVDEWGQQHILAMLTRYARTQFTNPDLV
jgi:AP-3 complex subunit beta